jgi:hypothetical protein
MSDVGVFALLSAMSVGFVCIAAAVALILARQKGWWPWSGTLEDEEEKSTVVATNPSTVATNPSAVATNPSATAPSGGSTSPRNDVVVVGGRTSANMTVYGTGDGSGQYAGSGIRIFKYPIQNDGKTLYPIAVLEKHWKTYHAKILKVDVPSRNISFYGHVVDYCRDTDCGGCCTRNAKTGFLIDVHSTAWKALNLNSTVNVECTFQDVGHLPIHKIPYEARSKLYIQCGDGSWKSEGKGCQ